MSTKRRGILNIWNSLNAWQCSLARTICAMVFAAGYIVSSALADANTDSFSIKTVNVDGTLLSKPYAVVASDGSQDTTYMPIYYIGQALENAGYTQSWDGSIHTWTLATSQASNYSQIPVGTGTANIVINGTLVKKVNTYVAKDPAAGANAQNTVYMPIYYIQQILTAANIPSSWNGQAWSIKTTSAHEVYGFVTNYGGSTESLTDTMSRSGISALSTFTDEITPGGGLAGTLNTLAESDAENRGMDAEVTVTNVDAEGNFDGSMANTILANTTAQSTLIVNIVNMVKGTGFQGVNIDFEMLPSSSGATYPAFLAQLDAQLHAIGKTLSVDVPAVNANSTEYNYAAIGAAVDDVLVMAYDFSYPGGPAGPIAPIPWVTSVLKYTTSVIPPTKVLLGIPMYGYDWYSGQTQALSLNQVDSLISADNISPQWDSVNDVPYFTYVQNGVTHTVYYENAQSISDELSLVNQYQLKGIALWHMGLEDNSIWQPIAAYANGA